MKELIGKCRTCFGCNRLEDEEFEGFKHCKGYIRANKPFYKKIIIPIAIEMLIFIGTIIFFYIKFSRLCGG